MNFSVKKILYIVIVLVAFSGGLAAGKWAFPAKSLPPPDPYEQIAKEQKEIMNAVLPAEGFQTKIVLGDAIAKLVESGAIDIEKFEKVYAGRGGLSPEQKAMLTQTYVTPLKINHENAQFLVNILWPLGITNKNSILADSEAGKPENVNNLASTGGWTLGKNENGGFYYNKFEIIKLTPEQDALVKRAAENIFRPCCGNSTAFPDCNHGAAILAMLQLGAVQGLSEQELYEEALKFNSYWFPDNYMKMAMLFKRFEKKPWRDVDPKIALSEQYSSGMGYRRNVEGPLSQVPGLSSGGGGGGSCGV